MKKVLLIIVINLILTSCGVENKQDAAPDTLATVPEVTGTPVEDTNIDWREVISDQLQSKDLYVRLTDDGLEQLIEELKNSTPLIDDATEWQIYDLGDYTARITGLREIIRCPADNSNNLIQIQNDIDYDGDGVVFYTANSCSIIDEDGILKKYVLKDCIETYNYDVKEIRRSFDVGNAIFFISDNNKLYCENEEITNRYVSYEQAYGRNSRTLYYQAANSVFMFDSITSQKILLGTDVYDLKRIENGTIPMYTSNDGTNYIILTAFDEETGEIICIWDEDSNEWDKWQCPKITPEAINLIDYGFNPGE